MTPLKVRIASARSSDVPPTGERVQLLGFVVRTLPGCEPGRVLSATRFHRWRVKDGEGATAFVGTGPPARLVALPQGANRPLPFHPTPVKPSPIAEAIFPDSMGLFVRVEPSPSRARRRPGGGPCPSLAGRGEGRCERLAQTSADWLWPWPGQPRGASPAMIRSRSVEVAGVGYRDWSDPCPGGGGLSQFEMFGVWERYPGPGRAARARPDPGL
jgi:hypothetical protein